MVYEEIMYGIKCDRCHEIYEGSDDGNLCTDVGVIEEHAEYDGWHIDGNRHYCPGCHTKDEDGNVTVRPNIPYQFFEFWKTLKQLVKYHFSLSETDTHYVLSYTYGYKHIDDARLSILREMIEDFEVEYRKPEKMGNCQPYENIIVRVPKDFKTKR